MQKFQDVVFNSNGQPVASATVLVRPTGSTSTAAIFGDVAGTGTRANPLTADANGRFWYYGTNGRYDLVVSGSYIQTTTVSDVILEDVPLSNLAELSTASAGRASLGLGSISTYTTSSFLQTANNLSELASGAPTVRTNIGAAASTSSQTLTGGQRTAVVALASTGQITPDFSTANNFTLSMTVNTTLAKGTNAQPGQSGWISVTQNSTAKTLAYDSTFYKFTATATLSTATSVGTGDVIRYNIITTTSAECEMRNGIA